MLPEHAFYKINWLKYYLLWRKYANRTMSARKNFMGNLLTVDFAMYKRDLSDGCFIECGTWRGGMAFALTEILLEIKEFHYFDSFDGLPPAGERDGKIVHHLQSQNLLWHNNNMASHKDFLAGMIKLERPERSLTAHKGWFEDTMKNFTPDRSIAVLRIDGDWYESPLCALENLFDQVQEGGLIIFDDYYTWDGCTQAIHDFFSKRKLIEHIRQSRYGGIAYVEKRSLLTPS